MKNKNKSIKFGRYTLSKSDKGLKPTSYIFSSGEDSKDGYLYVDVWTKNNKYYCLFYYLITAENDDVKINLEFSASSLNALEEKFDKLIIPEVNRVNEINYKRYIKTMEELTRILFRIN